jgi:N-methylhydantoinase A/oxoprolinase/acetone carboxylase beta subunit
MMRIGVDTGGTFTDLVLLAPDRLVVHKVRSTPDDPSRAILAGIADLTGLATGVDVVHGSTVATNAVLERRGARVALIATAGFEDVLQIGRQTRRELYNIFVEARRPIVEPGMTWGLAERVSAEGDVLEALTDAEIERVAALVTAHGAEAVAVCLLHSYRSPEHERRVASRLAQLGVAVSASHQILPEYREFERWSTTAVNAYVTPLMARYLGRLEERLAGSRLSIMQSNGGSISAASARSRAVQTILSGPAAGAVGARAVAEAAGHPRVISFDMGGTSSDMCLIDGDLGLTTESSVGEFPVRLPVIDIHTVGAGGGSIAYIDSGGSLRVGPRSAGAEPGPICYGAGTELTVTDANLLLGRLDPEYFLGGRMTLDIERTKAAARTFAARLGLSERTLAEGIVRVANANMERAIRVVSVQRGHDPRDFALLAFGGAGGMHACEIAQKLDIATVIAPRHAGVLSALGMLLADTVKDYSISVLRRTDQIEIDALAQQFAPLVEQASRDLAAEGFTSHVVIEQWLDVRYVGQSYEIMVPFRPGYRAAFDQRHARLYGYADPQRPTEIATLRVKATGITEKPQLPAAAIDGPIVVAPAAMRPGYFNGRRASTAMYRWEDLPPGAVGDGPAVIAGGQATIVVPPGFRFRVDGFGNVLAERAPKTPRARRVVADAAVTA